MKHIHTLTTQPSEKSDAPSRSRKSVSFVNEMASIRGVSSSNLERGTINISHIRRLWVRLTDTFGHKWVSSYGAEPSETWLAGLIDLSQEELKTGIIACLSWESEWPPTLPQFRSLCQPRREEAHQVYRKLPEPPEVVQKRKESGRSYLAEIREAMDRK